MNVGTIGYDCDSGLGHLVRDFHQAGIVNRVLVIEHPRYPRHRDWYGEDRYTHMGETHFLKDLDWLIIFENAFNRWDVAVKARDNGTKIAIMPMYEWTPNPLPIKPHLYLCPSLLDYEVFTPQAKYTPLEFRWHTAGDAVTAFTPVPVPRHIQWRQRERAVSFIHNAGHCQVDYAKGSPQVLEAWKYVKSPATLTVRAQTCEPRVTNMLKGYTDSDPRVTVTIGDLDDAALYAMGDVYINAERYNGLSLILQEAFASGMPVVTTDRYPTNTWLPNELLVPSGPSSRHRVNQRDFDIVTVDPRVLAEKVDELYGEDLSCYSLQGKEWGEAHSWKELGPKYLELLSSIG